MADQSHKAHHKSKEKKTRPAGSENPRAHTFANPGRYQRQAARTHDVKEKRLHVPLVDRLPEEAPPLVVGVVGPPQVGKTTLIKSLIRRYTKQTLSDPTGPLTVVTSKRRRLTFLECPAESLAAMIDVAKIVDIVLLMIDGKYGFEMETMEFLNVLSSTGMPGNVFGILTKLDLFKKQDTLRAQKKRLKHRFWSELYQGAKLFYLSGVVNGRYPDREILNLSRFLSVMKNPRPLVWRNSHPYCLADRFLDLTPPTHVEQNPKCDRTISLYGYLRGTNFPAQQGRLHIPGAGDFFVAQIEALPDPCPTPYMKQAEEKLTGKTSRRRLGEKQRILFAPMSDVGGVLVDKDAVYVDVKTSTFDQDDLENPDRGLGEQLVMGLHGETSAPIRDDRGVRLFGNASSLDDLNGSIDDIDDDLDELSEDEDRTNYDDKGALGSLSPPLSVSPTDPLDEYKATNGQHTDKIAFADSDSDNESISSAGLEKINADSDGESEIDDEVNLDLPKRQQQTSGDFIGSKLSKTRRRTVDLSKLIYDLSITPRQAALVWKGTSQPLSTDLQQTNGIDDEFFTTKSAFSTAEDEDQLMIPNYNYADLEAKWIEPDNKTRILAKFISNKSSFENAGGEDENASEEGSQRASSDDEGDGEFEDLETGETNPGSEALIQAPTLEAEREKNSKKKEELQLRFEEEDKEGFSNHKTNTYKDSADQDREFGEDEWYDAQKAKIQKQLDINRAEFAEMDDEARVRVEGFRAGTYARITLSQVPYEFVRHFNPRYPLILGGINPTEDRFGFVQVRIKRHRWHQKILKTNDPLIFSLGWRRFQSVPIYSLSDSRTRNRLLKYTPEHMHCFGTFYGPLIAPNTGFCCVQSFSNNNKGFRIAATGVVLNVDESVDIVKKLKLKGYPHKIYKNTAIIKDMFGSDLEIAKFKSGTLRTVSGVRGMIKGRAGHQYPEGYVRAGFEDKILMSDIVFLSSWRTIKPREFYMPVTNLIKTTSKSPSSAGDAAIENSNTDNNDDENGWQGMRLTSQVRGSLNIPTPSAPDSAYHQIDRPTRHFNPLRVPRKLQGELPFKSQITQLKPQRRPTYLQRRAVVLGGEERKARDLMQKVMTMRNEKVAKRAAAQEKRKEPYRRRLAENLEKKEAREKREKDEYWKREGKKMSKRSAEGDGVDRSAKKRR